VTFDVVWKDGKFARTSRGATAQVVVLESLSGRLQALAGTLWASLIFTLSFRLGSVMIHNSTERDARGV